MDDHERKFRRDARGIPNDKTQTKKAALEKHPDLLKVSIKLRLEMSQNSTQEISFVQVSPGKKAYLMGNSGILNWKPHSAFKRFSVHAYIEYLAGDGDHFHDDVAFDGLSPLVNPSSPLSAA